MLLKTNMFIKRITPIVLMLWVILMLHGCGIFTNPQTLVGKSEADVRSSFGSPTQYFKGDDGAVRMQYSYQPWGKTVWNIDLDGQGTVTQVYQVLSADYLYLTPVDGSWGQAEVLREFGKPAFVDHVMSWDGPIWNYRWRDNIQDMFYHIYFDTNGRVQRAHPTIDMNNARNEWK